ncbi:Zonular occludens toxin [Burkholderia sp. PAMC 28687]|uniref:zonular occludens toxin domain-containing protein n=1 Tax=Burkholderia sp. PAMC 28687 TaxID=1795874 RepID=UPI000781F525|nr:zonular occludens toxin domain-containing protein [Burkholderia sp. PAMC 28687]AMM14997.1 Zonular occludens toxin [Burkholderia sp. PAMC 28687]
MAINAYCGVMGSGKSYEVVQGPLLDAIAMGRRVVTNVDGISEVRIHDYLEKNNKLTREKLGRVVHVRTDDIVRPAFFPMEHESTDGATVTAGFVEPGDLVVVDEAWKLWASDKKIFDEHMAFFRMHRHFTHPVTGVACDVVLMIQGIADLHRKLKEVVELSFRMHKLKSLGLASGYRVEQYEGWKQNSKTRVGTYVRKYRKEIFPLYKSYAGAGGTEATVDKRQNVLANKTLWLMAAVGVVALSISIRFIYTFFHRAPKANEVSAMSQAAPETTATMPSSPVATTRPKEAFSDSWRIAGTYAGPGQAWVVVADSAGRLRVESPSMFQNVGTARVGTIDGDRVSTFSGAKVTTSIGSPAQGLGAPSR